MAEDRKLTIQTSDGREGVIPLRFPPGIDWDTWRLLTDKRLAIPCPSYLETHYSFIDGVDAHAVLDELDRAHREAQQAR